MKVRKGQAAYKIPPIGEMLHVAYSEELPCPRYAIMYLNPVQFMKEHKATKREGRPTYYTVVADRIWLHPRPDRRGDLMVRFYPPAQEV